MTESIASRVGRIISGTVNQLVDAAESAAPEAVLEQALREVDQAIQDVRAELGKVEAQIHLATQRLAEENRKHDDLSGKIRLALNEGREDLAETATERLLDVEAQIPVLDATLTEASDRAKELEAYINALKARKREMAEEVKRFRDSRDPGPGTGGSDGTGAAPRNRTDQAVEKANSAFDRVLERTAGLPGSGKVGDAATEKKLAELDAMAERDKVRERLARFRRDDS
jgi:phage shock protein A